MPKKYITLSDTRSAGTFSSRRFYQYNKACICVPVHELFEYARIFGFEPFWTDDGRFCEKNPPFCMFETRNQTCHLFKYFWEQHCSRRIFWANTKSGNFYSQKIARFLRNPPTPFFKPCILHQQDRQTAHQDSVSQKNCLWRTLFIKNPCLWGILL